MQKPQVPLFDLDKEIQLSNLEIRGHLPKWLEGTLLRNGPAKFHFPRCEIKHWFDGLAMLHAFTFSQGRVAYLNKFLRSSIYHQTMEKGNCHFFGFAQDPCRSLFRRYFTALFPSLFPLSVVNANVNIARMADQYVALTEIPLPVRFDPKTLETLGVLNYQDQLPRDNIFESAHPHTHFERKEINSYLVNFGKKSSYQIYAIREGSSKREVFCSLPIDYPSYMHSFSVTKRYFILVEYPLRMNPQDILLKPGGFISNFKWNSSEPSIFNVINRATGEVKKFEVSPFFCFHHVNAYEEGEVIILDLISYPDASIVYGAPPLKQIRKLERFILDLESGKMGQRVIAETNLELPRIHYTSFNGRPYRYVYGADILYGHETQTIGLLKIKVQTGEVTKWQETGCLAGEPIFVPHPSSKEEDDGILLSVVFDESKNHSFLLVLNAKDLSEVARAIVPLAIPYGLHGFFTQAF